MPGGPTISLLPRQWRAAEPLTPSARSRAVLGQAATLHLAAEGTHLDHEPGAAGNCTWGALQEWKTRTGSYPLTAGNAKDWNTTAATNKWYVTSAPTKRSIVVFEAGVQGSHPTYGHVAYVLDVLPQGGGAFKIYVREMNASASHGGGFGTYNYWTYTHTAGMSYIVSTL